MPQCHDEDGDDDEDEDDDGASQVRMMLHHPPFLQTAVPTFVNMSL